MSGYEKILSNTSTLRAKLLSLIYPIAAQYSFYIWFCVTKETRPTFGKGNEPLNLWLLNMHHKIADNSIGAFFKKLGTKKYFAPILMPDFEIKFFSSTDMFFISTLNLSIGIVPKFSKTLNLIALTFVEIFSFSISFTATMFLLILNPFLKFCWN